MKPHGVSVCPVAAGSVFGSVLAAAMEAGLLEEAAGRIAARKPVAITCDLAAGQMLAASDQVTPTPSMLVKPVSGWKWWQNRDC